MNKVKVLEDADFLELKELCENHDGWQIAYEKKGTKVWTKAVSGTPLHMIKVISLCIHIY